MKSLKTMYFKNNLDMTKDTLVCILKITKNFELEGYDRMIAMLDLRNRREDEVMRLVNYLRDASTRMEEEYLRAEKYSVFYNKEYATDINGYYEIVHVAFSKIRSHMSTLKVVMLKGRKGNHPSEEDCRFYNIEPKDLLDCSVMGNAPITYSLFPLEEQPIVVQWLYEYLKRFIDAEKKCMELCVKMIDEETKLKNSPYESNMLLEKERQKAWKKLEDEILLFADAAIKSIKQSNPACQDRIKYASEKDFAPNGLHKYNKLALKHYFIVDLYESMQKGKHTQQELTIWYKQPEVIDDVRKVLSEFDNLLPEFFDQKKMGQYMYFFCKWAGGSSVKKVCEYFIQNYHGKYKVVQYPAVNNHAKTFNEEAVEYREFICKISYLISKPSKTDWDNELSILLNT